MKPIKYLMVAVLVLLSFAPVSADSGEREEPLRTTRYVYDNKENRYKVVGTTTITGGYVFVKTSASIVNYGQGLVSNYTNITLTVSSSSTVSFSDGTTPNYTALTGSTTYYAPQTSGVYQKGYTFLGTVLSASTNHSFTTTSGVSLTFASVDSAY